MVSDRPLLNDEKTETSANWHSSITEKSGTTPFKSWNNRYRTRELRKKSWCLVRFDVVFGNSYQQSMQFWILLST